MLGKTRFENMLFTSGQLCSGCLGMAGRQDSAVFLRVAMGRCQVVAPGTVSAGQRLGCLCPGWHSGSLCLPEHTPVSMVSSPIWKNKSKSMKKGQQRWKRTLSSVTWPLNGPDRSRSEAPEWAEVAENKS